MKRESIIFSEGRLSVIEETSVSIFFYTDIVGIFCGRPYLVIETANKEKN
jgi:hypothetical protein